MNEPLLVNQITLSEILGISQPEVVNLVKQGLPRIEGATQKQAKYSVGDCVQWFIAHKTKSNKDSDTLRDAQIRKINLEADRIELELCEKRKEMIEIAKISQIWGHLLTELKTNMLNIPKQMSAIFTSFKDGYELEVNLTNAIHHTLDSLSRAEFLINKELDSK